MVSQKECINVWEVFQRTSNKPRYTLLITWIVLTVIVMVSTIQVFHYYEVFETRVIGFYDYIVWAITLGFLSIGLLIFFLWRPFKATYANLYHDIFMLMHNQEPIDIAYRVRPKEHRGLNKHAGLFQRHASMRHYREVNVTTESNHTYTYYDTNLIVSTGKSAHTVFRGLYYVWRKESNTMYQIRSKGRPHFKGTKFDKLSKDSSLALWAPRGKTENHEMKSMLSRCTKLADQPNVKQLYLAALHDEVHLAVVTTDLPKRQKKLDCESINALYQYFKEEALFPSLLLEETDDPFEL